MKMGIEFRIGIVSLVTAVAVSGSAFAGLRGAATTGQHFRRMMVSHYGNEIEIGEDKVQPYYVIDIDVPTGSGDSEAVSAFIGDMLVQITNKSVRVAGEVKSGRSDFGRALGARRRMFFEKSERLAFAGFAYLEGRADLSDERYIGYALHENSWTGSKTGGDYFTAFGVFGRALGRRLTLSDFFPQENFPKLDRLIRDTYAMRGPRESFPSFEAFRRKFPADTAGMTTDPAANDNFSITPHGLKWAFFDADIVGYMSAAKEYPIEIEVPWSQLEALLKDKALMPKVRF